MDSKKYFWYRFLILWVLGVLSTFAVMPYLFALQSDALAHVPVSLEMLVLISVAQSSVLLACAIGFGLKMADSIGIQAPLFSFFLHGEEGVAVKKRVRMSILLGVVTGSLIFVGDKLFSLMIPDLVTVTHPALWKGLLASLYGGVTEEILMRLFLMTLLLWFAAKIFTTPHIIHKSSVVVGVIIVVAVLFGLLHLPATALVVDITPLVVVRALVLNGLGALVFGWVYWRHGLELAMIAHFTADIFFQTLQSV